MVCRVDECDSLDRLQALQWLESDGAGAYAAGTLSGIHTRRQHGWLVVPDADGRARLLLSKIEESLHVSGRRHELGANQYPDAIHPQGYRYLLSFRIDPWPIWTWSVDTAVIERHLLLLPGRATLLIGYRVIQADGMVAVELRPLVAGRSADAVQADNPDLPRTVETAGDQSVMQFPHGGGQLVLTHPGSQFVGEGFWYYRFHYVRDDGWDDLYNPGMWLHTLHPGEELWLAAGTAPTATLDVAALAAAERARRQAAPADAWTLPDWAVAEPAELLLRWA